MKRIAITWLALAPACSWYFGDGDDDTQPPPDARVIEDPDAAPGPCLDDSRRTADCRVDVTGTVIDFTTQAPVTDPVEVHLTTGWDAIPLFPPPESCAPLEIIPVTAGAFSLAEARCDSPVHPPTILLLVVGATVAPTAADTALTCSPSDPPDCGVVSAELPAPTAAIAQAWRTEMANDGMPDAMTRGLVIMRFEELDFSPAAGAQVLVREGTSDRYLEPGVEVRFIAADRATLVRADATQTGVSGLAIVAMPAEAGFVGATRGTEVWQPIGVLTSPGWWFYERRSVSP
jgi:hypothetical protein